MEQSNLTYIVWFVRGVVPIILFLVWNLLSAKGLSLNFWRKPCHTREELLVMRKATRDDAVPDSFCNMRLVYEAVVMPNVTSTRRDDKARGSKRVEKVRTGSDVGKPPVREKAASDSTLQCDESTTGTEAGALTPAGATECDVDETSLLLQERMQVECLLNFVCFLHKDRPQRTFLPDTWRPPPPPRQRPSSAATLPEADATQTKKANADAQLALKAVNNSKLGLKRSDIAKALYVQLSDSNVRPSEATFSLIVESCVNASDLQSASAFLLRMEEEGHVPDPSLLNRVMDLCAESKAQDEVSEAAPKDVVPLVSHAELMRVIETSPAMWTVS